MKTRNIIIVFILLIALVGFGLSKVKTKTDPEMDKFAMCIKDSGAKFYGAWWCPHCLSQKALFGKSQKSLPYTECSDSNRKQLPICDAEKITGYPTWKFPDESTLSGEIALDVLSKKTNCALPEKTK